MKHLKLVTADLRDTYKVRANLNSISLKGVVASADITAAQRHPTGLKALIHKDGYYPK